MYYLLNITFTMSLCIYVLYIHYGVVAVKVIDNVIEDFTGNKRIFGVIRVSEAYSLLPGYFNRKCVYWP